MMPFTDFSNLQKAIKRIGIDEFEGVLLEKLKLGKLEGDTANSENLVLGENGIYHLEKGVLAKVILHITDIDQSWLEKSPDALVAFSNQQYDAVEFIAKLHKYHFTNCTTLQDMFKNGRKKRYYLAQKMDGTFNYSVIKSNKVVYKSKKQKLHACRNCLAVLGTTMNQQYNVLDFELATIFNTEVAQLNNAGFDLECSAVPNIYAKDWSEIAKKAKNQVDYKCQGRNCGIDLKNDKKYLHCHHIDANRANNMLSNLKVLCIKCHAEEVQHGAIKNTTEYIEFLKNYAR